MIAVIESGSKQYMVEKGHTIEVELLKEEKNIEFKPLLIIDGDKVHIGKPVLESGIVKATIADKSVSGEKIQVLKYKAKKRQSTKTGHRQKYTVIKIIDIKA